MNWWEKTVEYLFVKRYLPQVADEPNSYVAPLDGDHEIIGDVVFSRHTQWVLIEFKRNDSSLSSDNDKFPNYNRAKDALKDRDSLHFFVYGTASPDSGLILEACTYFSRKQVNIDTLIEGGVPYVAFSQYVADFVRFRKRGGDGGFTTSFSPSTDPRSGGGAFLDYSTVLGITTANCLYSGQGIVGGGGGTSSSSVHDSNRSASASLREWTSETDLSNQWLRQLMNIYDMSCRLT